MFMFASLHNYTHSFAWAPEQKGFIDYIFSFHWENDFIITEEIIALACERSGFGSPWRSYQQIFQSSCAARATQSSRANSELSTMRVAPIDHQ